MWNICKNTEWQAGSGLKSVDNKFIEIETEKFYIKFLAYFYT